MAKIPVCPPNLKPMTEFDACLQSWFEKCAALVKEGTNGRSTLERDGGKTYIKFTSVGTQRIVYCFVDSRNGNIYMAATWRAPALNHARGNILDEHNGMSWMEWTGARGVDAGPKRMAG